MKKMFLAILAFALLSCNQNSGNKDYSGHKMDHSTHVSTPNHSMVDMMNDMKEMHSMVVPTLVASTQAARPLAVPPLLVADSQSANAVTYSLVAMKGETAFKDEGAKTATTGYNGSFLGPVLKISKGQNVTINTANQLDEPTSYHWHGLEVDGNVDGGPHSSIMPGSSKSISFTVAQPAATLWFHPHAMGTTASQVYSGLAGLIYVDDDEINSLTLPSTYGVDDIPVILQDRSFDANNQINYQDQYNSDGVQGDTMLVNGTINPYFDATTNQLRLRLLNGSNARNYQVKLSNNATFMQIASDGGLLNRPVSMKTLFLTPGERAEIVIDLSKNKVGSNIKLVMDNLTLLTINVTDNQANSAISPSTILTNMAKVENAGQSPSRIIKMQGMMKMVTINGQKFDMDRIDFKPSLGSTEVWQVTNEADMMGGMIHPFHVHGVQFRIISRDGKTPPANEQGWKDTFPVAVGEKVNILVKYNNPGVFMYHCHNLEHEENGMMGQFEVVTG